MKNFFATVSNRLYAIRAIAIVSILFAATLALPAQIHEIYRVLFLDSDQLNAATGEWVASPIGVLKVTISALSILAVVVLFLLLCMRSFRIYARDHIGGETNKSLLSAAAICAGILTLPIYAVAYGLNKALIEIPEQDKLSALFKTQYRELSADLFYATLVSLGVAAAVTIVAAAYIGIREKRRAAHKPTWNVDQIGVGAAILTIVGSVIVIALMPIRAAQFVGPIPIISLFFATIGMGAYFLARAYDRHGIPVLSFLAVGFIVFNALDLNDNHELRMVKATPKNKPICNLSENCAFKGEIEPWLKSRPDLAFYRENKLPYPVFVVAAEGGGIYAAVHSGTFLARMQDACPAFSQHIFAISGVSGGSVGAAVFSAVASEQVKPTAVPKCDEAFEYSATAAPDSVEGRVNRILAHDYLTPLLWGMLFPDFLQRFLPVSIPQLDRARALEDTLAYAFDNSRLESNSQSNTDVANANPFTKGISETWSHTAVQPAVFASATNAESGIPAIAGPIQAIDFLNSRVFAYDFWWYADQQNREPTLASAVGLSARFPIVTPPAYIIMDTHRYVDGKETTTKNKVRFVDGGYYDNTGLVLARQIARNINDLREQIKAEIGIDLAVQVISLRSRFRIEFDQDGAGADMLASRRGTFGVAFGTLMSVRSLLSRERHAIATEDLHLGKRGVWPINLDHQVELPLGWNLSNLSRAFISRFAANRSFKRDWDWSPCSVEEFVSGSIPATTEEYNHEYSLCIAHALEGTTPLKKTYPELGGD